ncbi:MAG TPA: hypothetical protein P5205_20595 [Candidatus Paceibacterota bacterium]|nr:hypothetical protein [Verrucomicrobiota bacterium]HSA12765.1 hypothetical protein [Candidatus Paceibacterota bacterium]
MRVLFSVALLGTLAAAGCVGRTAPGAARSDSNPARTGESPANHGLIITPDTVLVGKVALVDAPARCVVLTFPMGKMPAAEQKLNLYRRGLRVGEVKITGPRREDNIVADLVAGEASVGDEARDR